ncbi:MAG TPA: alkaline phosphatase family protein [Thermoanaerobaculia bacterium]|nr:alkaline phosphatase family protein [Thermoanaerobaculia bacterium]
MPQRTLLTLRTRVIPACLALCLLAALPAAGAQAADDARTIILGFDGADAELTRQWMDEGKLPNLARLRQEGTFAPLRSTIPSQTPVSWSTFATGLDPGRHGVFDFLTRNVENYQPRLALVTESQEAFLWGERTPLVVGLGLALALTLLISLALKLFRMRTVWAVAAGAVVGVLAGVGAGVAAAKWLPVERKVAVNPRQGETFWQVLGKGGERVRVVRLPQNFPPEAWEHGALLSGLGTPDLSFRIGKPFYFTSELFFQPRGGGDFSVEVVELVDNRGRIETEIKGPPLKDVFPGRGETGYVYLPMVVEVPEDGSHLLIEVGDQTLRLPPGEWSDWVRFPFTVNPLIALHGIGRFRLLSLEPEVRLYLSPIQFDPTALPPGFALTAPPEFLERLTSRFGLFKTIGWAIDTWSLDEGTIDEDIFLEDVAYTVGEEEKMLYGLLDEADGWDVLVHYFEFTDRVQHMMFRLFDAEHPMYDAELAAEYGGSILAAYQTMDRIVGEVMRRMPAGTHLLVVSDHGFASFRWSMNYNTWLAKNGYMALTGEDPERKNLEDLFDQGDFFVNVDWSRTRAYALGLGNIYVNLRGREAQGTVAPGAEYEALLQEIKEKLEAYVDESTGLHPVAHVFTRDEAHGVYDPLLIPDLIPSNSVGYRVGWQDTLGGIGKEVVEPNTQYWSGDHCSVYPPLVNGILFSNLELAAEAPYIGDVMPTVIELHGQQSPEGLDGRSLLPR